MPSLKRSLLPLWLLVLSSACAVPLAESEAPPNNQCEQDSECGSGAVCVTRLCVSTSANLSGLVVQVDVPASALFGAGTSHLIELDKELQRAGRGALSGPAPAGYLLEHDLRLKEVAQLTTSFAVSELQGCDGLPATGDQTLPIAVELHPVDGPPGVPLSPYEGASLSDGESNATTLAVPEGRYDLYLIPQIPPEPALSNCHAPPTIVRNLPVQGQDGSVTVKAQPATALQGRITGKLDLSGWTIELLENQQGRTISTEQTLQTPVAGETAFSVWYWPDLVAEEEVDAILRLTPPETDTPTGMPTIFWKLSVIDPLDTRQIELRLEALAASTAVRVQGSVLGPDLEPAPGTIAIQSSELLGGSFGRNISYKTVIETDDSGVFSTQLLPGEYEIIALSTDSELAATKSSLTVEGLLSGGQSIVLQAKRTLSGVARTFGGRRAANIPAVLQPTSPAASTFLEKVLNTSVVRRGGDSQLTDENGAFSMRVEPGQFNLTLRPEASSNLPWSVLARLTIAEANEQPATTLGLDITSPVVVDGWLQSPPGLVIPGARIRAWLAPTAAEAESGQGVIQVGEAVSDDAGRYRLLLPASVTASLSQ